MYTAHTLVLCGSNKTDIYLGSYILHKYRFFDFLVYFSAMNTEMSTSNKKVILPWELPNEIESRCFSRGFSDGVCRKKVILPLQSWLVFIVASNNMLSARAEVGRKRGVNCAVRVVELQRGWVMVSRLRREVKQAITFFFFSLCLLLKLTVGLEYGRDLWLFFKL